MLERHTLTKLLLLGSASTLIAALGCSTDPGPTGSSSDTDTTTDGTETTTTDGTETTTTDGTETGLGCESPCEDPQVIADGLVQCADGSVDRVSPGNFDPTINEPACIGDETDQQCTTDDECTGGPNGRCLHIEVFDEGGGGEYVYCGCTYSCANDEECGAGKICLAPNSIPGSRDWPICVTAGCATNDECGECGECGVGSYNSGCGHRPDVGCRASDDECRTTESCGDNGSCSFVEEAWSCEGIDCVPGRPLLVDASARSASAQARHDWAPSLELPRDETLAKYWAKVAALEHASVASFSRFAQHLLSLGAPPALIRATQDAARDEIVHAQLAYGLASGYAGAAIGPGRLDLHGVQVASSKREIMRGLIEEACVGETLNVIEATAAAECAKNPLVSAILTRIARDELRHAQLAWRTLDWLLDHCSHAERRWALACLDRALAQLQPASGGLHRPDAGILGGPVREHIHGQARDFVLRALARTLVDGAPLEAPAGASEPTYISTTRAAIGAAIGCSARVS